MASAKMEEMSWLVQTNVTFSDEVETEGMVMIFNNYVADSYLNETTTQRIWMQFLLLESPQQLQL